MSEQRLIDATALRNKVLADAGASDMPSDWYKGVQYVIDYIVHAPTIEERKRGKWVFVRGEEAGNALYMCSECGKGDIHAPEVRVPYCWNCGADMRGEQDVRPD